MGAQLVLNDPHWLRREYVVQNRTARDIAETLGSSVSTVVSAVSRFNLQKRRAGKSHLTIRIMAQFPKLYDADYLRALYLSENLSVHSIAKRIGCSVAQAQYAVRRAGLNSKRGQEDIALRRGV
ncbi:MAG: hypothetical protein JNJ94_15185 [Chlorobi bacterium]|nr:hypothetical protein [Chlorobiota bacterium]